MDDEDIINLLKTSPQTNRTIIGNRYGNNTITVGIKMRILKLRSKNKIMSAIMIGTRCEEKIYFLSDKKYTIIMIRNDLGSKIYYCNDLIVNDNTIFFNDGYVLNDYYWESVRAKSFHFSEVIKCL